MNTSKLKTILLSLLVVALWGSLFPMVKIGYNAFNIDGKDVPNILMFAGTRFAVCGAVVCVISLIKKAEIAKPKMKSVGMFVLVGVFAIILHYAFTYIGLSMTDSSKTALIKQFGSLLYVCVAFLFIREERFSVFKIIGAVVGFSGIIAINITGNGIVFSVGDILIIAASFCSVIAGIISKKTLSANSPFWLTGISQLSGGAVLVVIALIMGASALNFDLAAFGVFAYICTASTVAYVLWDYILKTNDLSNLFIIKFAEPLFACIFGWILLGENILKWQYLAAFVLLSAGITIANTTAANKDRKAEKIKQESKV